jgi:hypothetical protein
MPWRRGLVVYYPAIKGDWNYGSRDRIPPGCRVVAKNNLWASAGFANVEPVVPQQKSVEKINKN